MPDIRSAIASTYVEPRGAGRAMVARIAGGEVLGAVGGALAGTAARTPDKSPVKAGKIGFLAVFPEEVVLFAGKRGAFKPKPSDEVILSLPRSSVSSAALEKKAVKAVLTLSLSDGEKWEFDMPRVHIKAAEKVAQALA
jgi:F0F1-type ATP synthase membrane subunit c/vacuolar-type H+-ATPase subunit K